MNELNKINTVSGFPDPDVPNYKKDKWYILAFIQAAYNNWIGSGENSFYSNRTRKVYAQSYRLGMQDAGQLKNLLNLKGEITEANVNYDPLPIVAKFADLIVNNILNIDYKVKLEMSDNISVEKKEKFKDELYKKLLNQNMAQAISAASGIDLQEKDIPDSEEDIMLRMEVDYRDEDEIALLALLNNVRNINDFDSLQREFVDDLITYGEAVVRHTLDPKQGIRINYVHDINFIRSISREKSNKNLSYAGEIKTISFADFRAQLTPEDGISDDEIFEMAKTVVNQTNGNSIVDWDSPIYKDNIYGRRRWYDDLTIDVVELEFIDTNYDLYEKKETRYGTYTIHKRPDGYKLPGNSIRERSLFTDKYKTVYKGTWVKGTDYVYNFGRADNILLEGQDLSEPRLNYSVYTIPGKSMVERMIPYADQMWISHIKAQQLMAKLRPSGIAVNVSALEDALEGEAGEYYEPIDLLDYYNISGDIMYRDDTEADEMPRRGIPITPLDNAMGRQLSEMNEVYNQNLNIIRDMTNVSKFLDGSQVAAKTAVGVQQAGIAQSNMGIDHLRYANDFIVKDSSKVCIMMMQDIFNYAGLESAYAKAIGPYSMKVIKRLRSIPIEQLNIKIDYGLTQLEEATLDKFISDALQTGSITIAEAIKLKEIDDIRLANKMLLKAIDRVKKEKMDEQEAAHQQQMQLQQAQQEGAAQAAQQKAKIEAQSKVAVEKAKADLELRNTTEEYKGKIKIANVEGKWKYDVANLQTRGQVMKEEKAENRKDKRNVETKQMESEIADQRANNTGPKNFVQPNFQKTLTEDQESPESMEEESQEEQNLPQENFTVS